MLGHIQITRQQIISTKVILGHIQDSKSQVNVYPLSLSFIWGGGDEGGGAHSKLHFPSPYLQDLPVLVTPLKRCSLSPGTYPPTLSVSSQRFGYYSTNKTVEAT